MEKIKILNWIVEHTQYFAGVLTGMSLFFKKTWELVKALPNWIKKYWHKTKQQFKKFILHIAKKEIDDIHKKHNIEIEQKNKEYQAIKDENRLLKFFQSFTYDILNDNSPSQDKIVNNIYNVINPLLLDSYKKDRDIYKEIANLFQNELDRFVNNRDYTDYGIYITNLGEYVLERICSSFTQYCNVSDITSGKRFPSNAIYYFFNNDCTLQYHFKEISKYCIYKRIITKL
jgi:hypothetical protein